MTLVLSLMPGIDLLGRAFQAEGFCVVRGGDPIFGGDVRDEHYPAGKFCGVISGPPCQTFSSLAHLVRANGHEPKFGNLIPEFERCVAEAQPEWFVMENVRAAPEPIVAGYGTKSFLLDNAMLDSGDGHGEEQTRLRRFTFGMHRRSDVPDLRRWIDLATFVLPDAVVAQFGDGRVTRDRPKWIEQHGEPRRRNELATRTGTGAGEGLPTVDGIGERGDSVPVKIGGSGKVKRTAVIAGHSDANESLTKARREKRNAVSSSNGGNGGGEHGRTTSGAGNNGKGRHRLEDALRLQGLPPDFFDHCPFTAEGKLKAVANGVPLSMGRQIARAVREAMSCQQ